MKFIAFYGLWVHPFVLPVALLWTVTTVTAWRLLRTRRERARRPGPSRWGLGFWLSLGLLLAVTCTPSRIGLGFDLDTHAPGWCQPDIPPGWPIHGFGLWAPGTERRWNVLIAVPLGAFAAAWGRRGRPGALARWAPLVALGVPVAIEVLQSTVKPLGRVCAVSDVLDNGSGVVLGFLLGLALDATLAAVLYARPHAESIPRVTDQAGSQVPSAGRDRR